MNRIRELLFSIRHPFDRKAIKARILDADEREGASVSVSELKEPVRV